MKLNHFLLIIVALLLECCSSSKDIMVAKGDQNDAVQNAISDYLHTENLSKKDSAFSISIGNINDKTIGVTILGLSRKLLPTAKDKVGTNNPGFPTRYLEREGKLFYWYDSTHTITRELIAALSKYHCIDSLNVNGFKGIPGAIAGDSKKAVDYYFCKCNLKEYKKVITSIAMGYYKPPKIECSCIIK